MTKEARMSLSEKALAVLAGIGLWGVAAAVLAPVETLLGPYVVPSLGPASVDLRVFALRALLPPLGILAGTALIGWLVRTNGWLYGIAAVLCLQLPQAPLSIVSLIQALDQIIQFRRVGPIGGWPYASPSDGVEVLWLLAGTVLLVMFVIGLGALGGLLGEWCARRSMALSATRED
jgi:hypothetical protein